MTGEPPANDNRPHYSGDIAEFYHRVQHARIKNWIDDNNMVPCTGCGKPMEDRGATRQWCAECSGPLVTEEERRVLMDRRFNNVPVDVDRMK